MGLFFKHKFTSCYDVHSNMISTVCLYTYLVRTIDPFGGLQKNKVPGARDRLATNNKYYFPVF